MLCRSCGRESRTTDACEWCRRPLNAAPPNQPTLQMLPGYQPTQPLPGGAQPTMPILPGAPPRPIMPGSQPTMQIPPGAQPPVQGNASTRRRVSLTGEVIEDVAPPSPVAPANQGLAYVPPTALLPEAVQAQMRGYGVPMGERWEKFLAIALPILALSMLIIHLFPTSFFVVGFADMFFIPMAMGAVGAVPSFDDAIADCSVILLVSLFINPALALVAYLIVCAIKQECNGALGALLLITLLVPFLMVIPLFSTEFSWATLGVWGMFNWMGFLRLFVGFLGWLLSSFFRQENE